ncbi:DUF6232 family protein [Plantactinospora sp. GCM10030261]|uniref:DUF6232 family protein n=1 Tax=Plantactinospora sp. GCM10030261 TaxID=3273420 RepID=UPI003623E5A4
MTTYYRDDTIQVTSDGIRTLGVTVWLRDIEYVWRAKGRGNARVRSRLVGRGILIFLLSIPPLVALVCVVSLFYAADDRDAWGIVIAIIAVGIAAAVALTPFLELPLGWLDRSYDRGGGVHELWIQSRGQEIMLLRTSDALRFGQIYRAVRRAVEQHTEGR